MFELQNWKKTASYKMHEAVFWGSRNWGGGP